MIQQKIEERDPAVLEILQSRHDLKVCDSGEITDLKLEEGEERRAWGEFLQWLEDVEAHDEADEEDLFLWHVELPHGDHLRIEWLREHRPEHCPECLLNRTKDSQPVEK